MMSASLTLQTVSANVHNMLDSTTITMMSGSLNLQTAFAQIAQTRTSMRLDDVLLAVCLTWKIMKEVLQVNVSLTSCYSSEAHVGSCDAQSSCLETVCIVIRLRVFKQTCERYICDL